MHDGPSPGCNTGPHVYYPTTVGLVSNPFEQLTLDQLRRRTSLKWATYPGDVLPLWVAEMDVSLAPSIAAALRTAIDLSDTGYPAGTGLAEAVSGFAARRWGWNDLDIERTAVMPDVMNGVVNLLRLVTNVGDAVVVNPPVYSPFYAFVAHDGRRLVEAPLADDRLDLDALERVFAAACTTSPNVAYLLCNPHNPTGTVHTADELSAVALLARRYGVRVVSDEIHGPVVLPGAHFTPFLTVPGAENGFALTSASKAWNLAGLKSALAIAGPEAAADLRRIPEEVSHGPSHFGMISHAEAFRTADAWLDDLLIALDDNRRLVGELVAEQLPGVRFRAPQGTYLAWLDCRELDLGDEPVAGPGDELATVADLAGPAQWFLDNARVALSSGHVFGNGGAGHVRLNFGTSKAILTEAIARMSQAVEHHPDRH